MVNFTNPGILGDVAYFRRYYEVSSCCFHEILFLALKYEIEAYSFYVCICESGREGRGRF